MSMVFRAETVTCSMFNPSNVLKVDEKTNIHQLTEHSKFHSINNMLPKEVFSDCVIKCSIRPHSHKYSKNDKFVFLTPTF